MFTHWTRDGCTWHRITDLGIPAEATYLACRAETADITRAQTEHAVDWLITEGWRPTVETFAVRPNETE